MACFTAAIRVSILGMEGFSERIFVHYLDNEINQQLKSCSAAETPFPRCYNHNEEFFLRLDREFTVPQLPVHHDINQKTPEKKYLAMVREFISGIIGIVPGLFDDLTYFFDPEEIHKLKFLKLYTIEQFQYLYLLKIDLLFRNQYCEIIKRGSNDMTAMYKSNSLFLEAAFIPVEKEVSAGDQIEYFRIKQAVSETWIGERGRGYFVKGIWMDDDLTKFFSKLFLPEEKSLYPYYPFICKYKTVCLNLLYFSSGKRKTELPYLHRAIGFLLPKMNSIQKALKYDTFSEDLLLYKKMKKTVPDYWKTVWQNVHSRVFLNENQMREFIIEI